MAAVAPGVVARAARVGAVDRDGAEGEDEDDEEADFHEIHVRLLFSCRALDRADRHCA